ncbi:MAG: thioredoxin family protein [Salibacteraceae bacterium]
MNYEKKWSEGMSYDHYRSLITDLLKHDKTTGNNQSEELTQYTALNEKRMARIDKTVKINEELVSELRNQSDLQIMVITEAWCGDAAQSVPVINAVAKEAGIEVRHFLRDQHEGLMDQHLTNSARSIPILLFFDSKSDNIVFKWGPRPAELQRKVLDYKTLEGDKPSYDKFLEDVQLWYAGDKFRTMQNEWLSLITDYYG